MTERFITSDNFTAIQQEKIDAIQKSLLKTKT